MIACHRDIELLEESKLPNQVGQEPPESAGVKSSMTVLVIEDNEF